MIKKILMILGAAAAVVILCIAGVKGYTAYLASQYDDTAIPYLQKVIPEISTWEEDAIRSSMSGESLDKISPETFSAVVGKFSRLGALKSFDTPRFDEVSETRANNALYDTGVIKKTLIYTSNAVYENGEAIITLKLSVKDDNLEVQYFNIQSEILTE